VFNFDAINARLDFIYAVKTPLRVIQQELATLMQGDMPMLKYYDEIEKKVALLTNKTIMSHEEAGAMIHNEQHRNNPSLMA